MSSRSLNRTTIGELLACTVDTLGYSATPWLGYNWLIVLTALPDDVEPELWNDIFEPDRRYLRVVHGARRKSSWSRPIMFAPLGASTPTTFIPVPLTRISLPTGDSPSNSSRATVCPIKHTAAPRRTSSSVNGAPSLSSVQLRIFRYSGVLPLMLPELQFLLP